VAFDLGTRMLESSLAPATSDSDPIETNCHGSVHRAFDRTRGSSRRKTHGIARSTSSKSPDRADEGSARWNTVS